MSCLLNLPGLGLHLPVADGGNLYLFALILALPQLPPPHFKNIVWVAGVLVPVVSLNCCCLSMQNNGLVVRFGRLKFAHHRRRRDEEEISFI